MKFLQIMGRSGNSSYISFEFSDHDAGSVCVGDQIWSNGHEIEISEWVDGEDLRELIDQVENKQSFSGALRRMELI